MSRLRVALGLALVTTSAVVVNGCGGSKEEACVKLARSLCSFTDRCTPFVLGFQYGTTAACEALETDRLCATLGLTKVLVSGSDYESCASALDAASCGPTPDLVCPQVYQHAGEKKGGASCFSNLQCQSVQCVQTDPTTCGSCVDLAKPGEPCSGLASCDPDHWCDGTCQPRLSEGSACTDSAACERGLFCLDGACAPPLQAGDDCAGNEAACDVSQGLLCVVFDASTVCTLPTLSTEGEPCGLTPQYVRFCSAELYCAPDQTCAPRKVEGEACGSAVECAPGLGCAAGACVVPTPAPSCQ